MIRKLKILMLAAMAMAAVSAVGAPSVQAAEFHCSVEPCRVTPKPDGAVGTKTSHHMFDVNLPKQVLPITCKEIQGEGTATFKTVESLTIQNIQYQGCEFLGVPALVEMNGCDYLLTAAGEVQINCPPEKQITFGSLGCVVHVPAQGPFKGITFHNIPEEKSQNEITVSASIKGIQAVATGAGCPEVGESKAKSEYTTGNVILTGEQDDAAAVHANVWWA